MPEAGLVRGGGEHTFNHLCELFLRPHVTLGPDPGIPVLSATPPTARERQGRDERSQAVPVAEEEHGVAAVLGVELVPPAVERIAGDEHAVVDVLLVRALEALHEAEQI